MSKQFSSILLVDDDDITNFLNENLLQEMKVAEHIDIASDGLQALNFIKNHWTSDKDTIHASDDKLILLDINMPVMNGFEFLEQFAKMKQSDQVKIALLTTSVNKRDMERAEEYKVKDYVEKPLNREKISALLRDL